MEVKRVALVLVDISGYTRFITHHIGTVLHAEAIITDLLETVIDKSEYPLTLSKLEGDAAFLYAILDGTGREAAQGILKQVDVFIDAFRSKERSLIACLTCSCEACQGVDRLRLKAFLHTGQAVIKKVHQIEELGGEDVILIHRLLKNTIPVGEYILLTDAFNQLSGGIEGRTPEARSEFCEGIGNVAVKVYYPPEDKMPAPARPTGEHEPGSEVAAKNDALMEQFGRYILARVTGRVPRRKFYHLEMRLTPRNVWEFLRESLAHVGDVIHIMREGEAADQTKKS